MCQRFFPGPAQYGGECPHIVVRLVADLSEDSCSDISRLGPTFQSGKNPFGARWIVWRKDAIADTGKDDGPERVGCSRHGSQQRNCAERESNGIYRQRPMLLHVRKEMAGKICVSRGIVRFRCRTVTGEIVGNNGATCFAKQLNDSGSLPGVGERTCPTVDEEYWSRRGHGG